VGRQGDRKDSALASTTFKAALKDQRVLVGQKVWRRRTLP
jgi:hypothetical protein